VCIKSAVTEAAGNVETLKQGIIVVTETVTRNT
jgi:hypothetical protein